MATLPLERVVGPVRGYFIAAYASPAPGCAREYASYYKVCATRPEGYFGEALILHKGGPPAAQSRAGTALELAIVMAMELVNHFPEAQQLPAWQQRRSLFFWEAAELGLT